MKHVWLSEIVERDREGHVIYTGRFDCEFDEGTRRESAKRLSLAEALDWARARADRIWLDAEGTRWDVGAASEPDFPPLSPYVAERLERGRRRPAGDEWIDRDASTPPTPWEVTVELSPDSLAREARTEQEQIVARVARRLKELGCSRVSWNADGLDAGLEEIDRQWRAAGEPEGFGWMIPQSLAFELTAVIQAPTHRPLMASVREAVLDELHAAAGTEPYEAGASDIEVRWGAQIDVHPPGYQPPHPHPV